jgi:hypothetical protein
MTRTNAAAGILQVRQLIVFVFTSIVMASPKSLAIKPPVYCREKYRHVPKISKHFNIGRQVLKRITRFSFRTLLCLYDLQANTKQYR